MIADKSLGIKIGSEEEKRWTGVKERAEEGIESSKIELEIQKCILALANKKIAEEKKKFK